MNHASVIELPSNRLRNVSQAQRTVMIECIPSTEIRPAETLRTIPVYSLKSTIDIGLAVVLAIVTWPVMLLAMLLVRCTSAGPAIYSQTRVGRGGRIFTIYKIRTMFQNCEQLTGPQWSTKGDRRITPVGKVLRALHIDELPQLWNVLRGDMSLIGPRPERPEIVETLRDSVYGYDYRLTVKPGITGFAQIHLPPDSCIRTVKNKLIYDRFYISRMGLMTDVKILGATALKVLGLRGVYHRPPNRG